ncbi:MAG: hypothetical protein VXA09_04525 [Burkholderiaceae bacterium]
MFKTYKFYSVFYRLPAIAQKAFYDAAMRSGDYFAAWNMADHADHKRLDVDAMMFAAEEAARNSGALPVRVYADMRLIK